MLQARVFQDATNADTGIRGVIEAGDDVKMRVEHLLPTRSADVPTDGKTVGRMSGQMLAGAFKHLGQSSELHRRQFEGSLAMSMWNDHAGERQVGIDAVEEIEAVVCEDRCVHK